MKKIFLLLGHPDSEGLCNELAAAYEETARGAGHQIVRMDAGAMRFDPILRRGYRARQELEPDLVRFREAVTACDHFVIVHPLWWSGMPALLKGIFDRAWLPGSAFRYIKTRDGKNTLFWHRLFRGKSARIIVTSGTPPFLVRFLPGTGEKQLRWGILWFAGFRVRTLWFGPSEGVPEERKKRWLQKVRRLAARAA